MTGTLEELLLAATIFVVGHFLLSAPPVRDRVAGTLGERGFRGVYSVLAIATLVWTVMAFNAAPMGALLWWFGPVGDWIPLIVMPPALVLLVGGLTAPNPLLMGGDRLLEGDAANGSLQAPARGVLRITRNPMMWAIGLWGLAHLAAGGTARTTILFAAMTVLALGGTVAIDAKALRRKGEAFARYEAATSNLPFLAMAQGRQSLGAASREFGAVRLIAVVVLYAALLHGHRWLFGVSPLAAV